MIVKDLLEFKKYSHSGTGYVPEGGQDDSDPDRGPHEGKEVAMILDGVKPAGIIGADVFDKLVEPHVKAGKIIAKKFLNRLKYDEYVIALPGEERRIDAIIKLLQMPPDDRSMSKDVYHVRLGRLLGYTKDQVRKFLTGDFKD